MIHVFLAFVFFDEFSIRVMWYVSQGLMGIFLGALNIIVARYNYFDPVGYWLTNSMNMICLAFIAFYLQADNDPQGYVMTAILLLIILTAWSNNRKKAKGIS